MTQDEAIAIRVRLDTAIMALVAAIEAVAECAEGDKQAAAINTQLHVAHNLAAMARGACLSVLAEPSADPS